jgi:hypothetical protein
MRDNLEALRILVIGLGIAVLPSSAFSADCPLARDVQRIKEQIHRVRPDPLDVGTIRQQEQLRDDADTVLRRAFKEKQWDDTCSSILLKLLVDVAPYDTDALLNQNYTIRLKGEFNKSDSAVKRAFDRLSADEKKVLKSAYSLQS